MTMRPPAIEAADARCRPATPTTDQDVLQLGDQGHLGGRDKPRAQREEEQAESHLDDAEQGQVAEVRPAHLADMGEGSEHGEHQDLRQARGRGH